ncbi:MAG: hypothetical protein IPG92_07040 [Flavobacteriales bacterium]|nr:hypothetical protein [Flavobacteriales bacterium]
MFIRIWHYTGNAGTFQICARDPVTPTGCYFTLNMADSGGDGWNGAYVQLCVGGSCTNYQVFGSLATITFTATIGQLVTLQYVQNGATFTNQIAFQLLASNGLLLYGSPNPLVDTGAPNYGLTVNPSCNVPPSPPSDCLGLSPCATIKRSARTPRTRAMSST